MTKCSICENNVEWKEVRVLTSTEMWGLDKGMYSAGIKFEKLPESLGFEPDGWVPPKALNSISEWILCSSCASKVEKCVSSSRMGVTLSGGNSRTGSWPSTCEKCRRLIWDPNFFCPHCGYIEWNQLITTGAVGLAFWGVALFLITNLDKNVSQFALCPGIIGLVLISMVGWNLSKIWKTRARKHDVNMDDFVALLVALYDKSPNGEGFVSDSPASQPVIDLGKKLNQSGGKGLMLKVHARFAQKRPTAVRNLEILWDGIGDWRG